MNPISRKPVSKGSSVGSFNRKQGRTKAANFSNPMRGGIRL